MNKYKVLVRTESLYELEISAASIEEIEARNLTKRIQNRLEKPQRKGILKHYQSYIDAIEEVS